MTGRTAATVSSSSAVGFRRTGRPASSGSHGSTLSSRAIRPDSTSRSAATAVTALVMDWMRTIASSRSGGPSTDARPTATTSGDPWMP